MTSSDIAPQRLNNQHLIKAKYKQPSEVVRMLGAVQAQDYAGAKWALGMRLKKAVDDDVEQAFTDGSILRTHLMRPTWHFVTPADIRWLLALTAPRVQAVNAFMYRKLELDSALFKRSNAALAKALRDGNHLNREELADKLQRAGIPTKGELRMGYLLMKAELDGLICSGPRHGKQFTYALLEERVPPAKNLDRDEALAKLIQRYFATRGPATAADFAWWSGLTITDAKRGLELCKPKLEQEGVDGKTYWFAPPLSSPKITAPTAHLLPNYDEYFIGFKDRSAFSESLKMSKWHGNGDALSAHIIVINGQIVGGWRRTLKKDTVIIQPTLLLPLTKDEQRVVAEAAETYGEFLGLQVSLLPSSSK